MDYEIPRLSHTINGRSSMRSVADALEALRNAECLLGDSVVEIRTRPLPSRSSEAPSIVLVVCRTSGLRHTWGVALPTSWVFKGRRVGQEATESFEISLLDRARVDKDGIVTLSDGTCLQAVNVIPAVLPWELTQLEKRIVYWTIKFIGPELYAQQDPDLEGLNYGWLRDLDVPKLDAIVRFIEQEEPELGVCRQTVANALGRSGMRAPRLSRGKRGD